MLYARGMAYRITSNPEIRGGKPCIRGMRITVTDVLEYMAGGDTIDTLLAEFPELEREDLLACFAFAAEHPNHPVLLAAE